jgi:hypothetical protein
VLGQNCVCFVRRRAGFIWALNFISRWWSLGRGAPNGTQPVRFPFETRIFTAAPLSQMKGQIVVLFVYPSASKSKEESQQPPSECMERNL